MVARTPLLNSLKTGFLSRIHQPLPLGKRESEQLLGLITTSFRKNLDREHVFETDTTTTIPKKSTSPLAIPPTTDETYHPTDRHLRAVLLNPLFTHARSAGTIGNDPFVIFDAAVSKGLMTTKRAAGFLAIVRSQLSYEYPEDFHQRMGMAGAGLHVLRWLRASGQEKDLGFLGDPALVRLLVPVLYAEGLHEVVQTWLIQLASRSASPGLETTQSWANASLLSGLMDAMMSGETMSVSQLPNSLDESFATLAKVNSVLPRKHPVMTKVIRRSWARLSRRATIYASRHPKPSVMRFEEFVEMGRPLSFPLDLAHLDLHHPTTPTHSAAIEYLRLRPRLLEKIVHMNPWAQRRVLCLARDASVRLNLIGQVDEASWVERLRAAINEKLGRSLEPRIG